MPQATRLSVHPFHRQSAASLPRSSRRSSRLIAPISHAMLSRASPVDAGGDGGKLDGRGRLHLHIFEADVLVLRSARPASHAPMHPMSNEESAIARHRVVTLRGERAGVARGRGSAPGAERVGHLAERRPHGHRAQRSFDLLVGEHDGWRAPPAGGRAERGADLARTKDTARSNLGRSAGYSQLGKCGLSPSTDDDVSTDCY